MTRNNKALKKTVYVKSSDRKTPLTTTSTNIIVDIGENIHNINLIEVEDAAIHNVIYNVNANNQNIYWNDTLAASHTTVIPIGNYTLTQILAAVKVGLDADETGAPTYTVEVPVAAVDEKVVITASAGTFELITTTTTNALWEVLGYSTIADKTGAGTYTAENIYNLTYTDYINIACPTLVDSMEDGLMFSDKQHRPILAKIRRNDAWGSILFLNPHSRVPYRASIKNQGNSLKFELLDDNFLPISLNGHQWSMAIVIHYATQD